MILIIGGAARGKNEYADRQYGDGYTIIHDFQNVIFEQQKKGEDAMKAAVSLLEEATDLERLVIVCDEVGYGLVPVDASERRYRETVGRVSCYLAERATCVVRIVAGIPVRIK